MKKIDLGSDEDFINNYKKLKSSRKMSEKYNCSKDTILKHAREIGYDVNSNKEYKLSKQNKEDIVKAYNNETSTSLAEKYHVSRGMITKIWYDNNLKGKLRKKLKIKDDLSGKKINNLFIIEPTDNRSPSGCIMYLCECDCGTIKEISGSDIKSGKIKSCGCLSKQSLLKGRGLNFKDLTNQKFGQLTAIKRCEDKIFLNGQIGVQWLCKCSCGRITKFYLQI